MKVRCIEEFEIYGHQFKLGEEYFVDDDESIQVDGIGFIEYNLYPEFFEEIHTDQIGDEIIIKKSELTNTDEYYFNKKLEEIITLLIAKNKDYGNSFDDTRKEYGSMALEIKLTEKLSRYKQLARNKNEVVSESIIDTLNDIIGYCLLELRYRDKND